MPRLFDPLEVDGLNLDSRIVLPPMHTGKANDAGKVTDSLVEHYRERAEKAGLVIIEHSYVSPKGKHSKNQLGIDRGELISGLERLANAIKRKDTPAIIQINHAGGRAKNGRNVNLKPVSPSGSEGVRKLEAEEIDEIIESFAEAADRAVRAGFDGVEVHGAHGFLLNQFYSPIVNQRSDMYGGSFEDRIRLPIQVVERVRDVIGDRALLYRLGSVDLDPDGNGIEDSKKFSERLVDSGVDILDVSGGVCGSRPSELEGKQGFFVPQASEIKKSVEVPVIGVGGIRDPEYTDKVVREGSVDLVAVGRAQLSNPNWANKAAEKLE